MLHVRNSAGETVTGVPGRGDVQVHGLSDEQLPIEDPTQCGGLNTSLSDDTITLGSPLAPGATIDVVFLLGVEQAGHFRFYVNVEALEASGPVLKRLGRPAASKKPPALPAATSSSKPAAAGTTPAPTRPATPPATQGLTPSKPAITPGVWRKLSPDATPDEPPATPAAKRTRRDSR